MTPRIVVVGVVVALGVTACGGGGGKSGPTSGKSVPSFCKPDSPVVKAPGGKHKLERTETIGALHLQPPNAGLTSGKAAITKRLKGTGATLAAFSEYADGPVRVAVVGVLHLPGEYYKARVNFLCGAANGVAISPIPVALYAPGHADAVMCFNGPPASDHAEQLCGWVDDTAVALTIRAADVATARALAVQVRAAIEKPA